MAHRLRHLAFVATVCWLLLAQPAFAIREDGRAEAKTEDDSVVVRLHREADGSVSVRRASGSTSCEWHATEYQGRGEDGGPIPLPTGIGARPSTEHDLYFVWCGDYSTYRWFGPADFDDPAPIAEDLVRRLTVLPANVDVRPDRRGVTGIPSMFWVEGYDAQPLTATESAFGLTVAVNIQLVEVEWDFGDGTPVVQAGLGEAWPERSSVQHAYRTASGRLPFSVTATLLFQPTYTVNGVAGPALDPIQVPITRDYVVHQVQAQRTR